jgi:hypothetical protein
VASARRVEHYVRQSFGIFGQQRVSRELDLASTKILPSRIAGKDRTPANGERFDDINPATGEVVCSVAAADAALDFYSERKSVYVNLGRVDAPY